MLEVSMAEFEALVLLRLPSKGFIFLVGFQRNALRGI
jgi:hypothetical protein